ncbi:LysR family transcriptional regulator [Litoreibacter ponti]|nr:LysR family transcriptional regulator [Litoreibacter ponti]
MNWDEIAFDWNHVRAFLATVEEGSLSAAARATRQAQPTLGRQVAALEEALGVTLFERVGRKLVLTPSGAELVAHVRTMGEAATRISLAASGQSQSVAGLVRISASDVTAAFILPNLLRALRQRAPELEIELIADNNLSDLQHRDADIAIRHVRPEQPELIARKLHDDTASFYATHAYLEAAGRPAQLSDLNALDFIAFFDTEALITHFNALGMNLTKENFRLSSNSGVVGWQMVCAGLGIGIMSDRVAARAPEVVRVLPSMEPLSFPTWLVSHRELLTSARIRLVYDYLAKGLR